MVENDRPPSFQGAPQQTPLGRSQPDGWDSARFLGLFLSYESFPFRELVLPSRTLKGQAADRWAAERKDKAMITELLKNRFSVRKFQDKPIPDDVVKDMLEAGRLSPSGGNEQPWAFGVVTDRSLIAQIVKIACQQEWIAKAPLLIVLCTVGVGDERGGRDIQKNRFPEYNKVIEEMDQEVYWALNQEEHQTKIAGTHMALVALEHGVGSCWVSRFDVKCLAKLLNLPRGYMPSEILVLGYPEEERKLTKKKELYEVVFYNTFG